MLQFLHRLRRPRIGWLARDVAAVPAPVRAANNSRLARTSILAWVAGSLIAAAHVTPALAANPPTLAKSFGAVSIPVGGSTTLTFTVTNPNASTLTGVGFSDTFPFGLAISTPNGLAGSCGGGTITATAGSGSLSLSGATLAAGASCTVTVDVTATGAGFKTNTTSTVTSNEGGSGPGATATIDVTSANPPTISKAFGAASIPIGGSTTLSFTIANPNGASGLSGVGFSDTFPAGLVISTPNGLTGACGGGTITATAGGTSVALSNAALGASASCSFSVAVTGTSASVKVNTTSPVTSTEGGNGLSATATVTVTTPNPPTISKSFGAATIPVNGATTLNFTIMNPNAAASLSGIGFSDTLPAGLAVATPNALVGSCGGGTITATAGGGSVGLSGATLGATASCSFSVAVVGTSASVKVNTTSPVTSNEGGNGLSATATITVTTPNPPSISKSFGAATIAVNGTTTLNFTITNPNGAGLLTGIGFTDTFPSGLVVSTPNGLAGSCGGGTITATAGGTGASLSGATLGANASCTFSVNVRATSTGTKINTAGPVTSNEGGNGNSASATLTVGAVAPPTIAKAFGAAAIPVNASTTLSFTITNPNGAAPLTGIGFTDTFPAGLGVATPNGLSGSCGGGTITATAGSGAASLAGATLGPNASCTFAINVTGTSTGTKNNTTSPVTSNEAGNGNSANASLTVSTVSAVAPPTIAKSFAAASIPVNGTTTLSFTVTNPNGAASLTGVGFTDTFPVGLVVAAPNGLSGSCGGGSIAAAAGSGNASLSGATLAAGASCNFSVTVSATSAGVKTNVTGTVTSNEGGTGGTATASLTVIGAVVAAPPTVTSVAPNTGATNGGTGVVITGSNFTGAIAVKFGGASAATFAVLSATQITATSPAGSGSVDITVTTPAGTSAISPTDQFTYVVPADSVRLRALQVAVTNIEAQSSGQAISGAIGAAVSDGFNGGGQAIVPSDTGLHFNFAPEPEQQSSMKDRVGGAFSALAYAPGFGGPLKAPPPRIQEWLGWADLRGVGWNTDMQAGDIRGGQVNALIGLTRRVAPDLLVGVLAGYEHFDYTSQLLSGRLKGDGWTAGAYLGWRVLPGVRFDAGLSRSGIDYNGVAGTAAGTFPGSRWLATAALTGIYKTAPGFEIEPSARIYALWEHDDAYTDSLGTAQSALDFATGRASAGAKVAYPVAWWPTTTVAPYLGLYADYYFNNNTGAFPTGATLLPTEFIQGWSGRVTSGIAVMTLGGPTVSVGGELGGLGGDFKTWAVRGRASVPF